VIEEKGEPNIIQIGGLRGGERIQVVGRKKVSETRVPH